MPNFCIPKKVAEQLKEAARKGDIDVAKMYERSSAERIAYFERYVEKGMAKEINAGFEKAMVSDQVQALETWAKKTFTGAEKKGPRYKDVMAKIRELNDSGVINPKVADGFLEDLVAKKLGAYVTPEEVAELTKRANKLEELANLPAGMDGNPPIEYFKYKNETDDYIASLAPSNRAVLAIHTLGRINMLAQTSSATINIISNIAKAGFNQAEMILAEAADSIKSGKLPVIKGVNSQKALDYIKYDMKRFLISGSSTSRMIDWESGKRLMGEERLHSQGKGAFRKVTRVAEDVVMKYMQGTPDIAMANIAFAHTTNLLTTKWAKEQGFKGKELKAEAGKLFDDVTKVNPETEMGKEVRAQAMEDAMRATNTHNSVYSDFALKLRQAFDDGAPNLKIGTAFAPFVKTPANAIGSGLDAAGMAVLDGVRDFVTGRTKGSRIAWKNAVRKIIRSGLPITAALLLSTFIKKNGYTGDYDPDPKVRALRDAQNLPPNSYMIGDNAISADYLGPLSTVLNGILKARDSEGSAIDKAISYGAGNAKVATSLPGLTEWKGLYDAFAAGDSPDKIKDNLVSYAANFGSSRLIPAFVSNIAKSTDKYERQAAPGDFFGQVATKIPGLREGQPIKTTFTGQKIETESPLSIMLFGSRVKTVIKDEIAKEYQRLDDLGMGPSIANLDRPSGDLAKLKGQIGQEKYNEVKDYYRTLFSEKIGAKIQDSKYQDSSADMKKAKLDAINEAIKLKTLHKFGFKREKKVHTPDTGTAE